MNQLINEVNCLESGGATGTGDVTVTIIRPGFNKSRTRFYPADVLKRDHKVFEGLKMFSDHPTEAEEKSRPEGSIRNWAGQLKRVWVEADGKIRGAVAVIDEALKSKLKNLSNQGLLGQMGVSIRAVAEGKETTQDGIRTTIIEKLVKGRSVDFVTYSGAGGQVEAMESHREGLDLKKSFKDWFVFQGQRDEKAERLAEAALEGRRG